MTEPAGPQLPSEHEPLKDPSDSVTGSKRPRASQGRRGSASIAPPATTGTTAPALPTNVTGVELPLPHERDQGLAQVAGTPDPLMLQAMRDLDAGQVDTDMRAMPGLDAERRNHLVPTVIPQTPSAPQPAPRARTTKRR